MKGAIIFIMLILSFDCANKSLAYSLIDVNIDLLKEILNKYPNRKKNQEIIIDVDDISTCFTYVDSDVADLLDGKKLKNVSSVDRAKSLRKYIDNKKFDIDINTNILIEKQPEKVNVKSCSVSDQLLYHFANQTNISTISPSLKNKISFTSENNSLIYNKFVTKYSSSYIANKNHAKENFLHFINKSGQEHVISNVKKSNYNDIADSFMQIIAYYAFNY